jgi:hypothetical protein
MQPPDYDNNVYLAVTLNLESDYLNDPSALRRLDRDLAVVGQVGQLPDVQLLSVPKAVWDQRGDAVQETLRAADGVLAVQVQTVKARVKRMADEF